MTTIEITPPGKSTENIQFFTNCSVNLSTTSKTGSFSIVIQSADKEAFDKYPVGSDVRINQDGNIFRGWILNPTKQLNGVMYITQLQGLCYTGRTQKIIVTESYEGQKISDIVKDLFTKYAPEFNRDSIVKCDKVLTIKLMDIFFFDAMEQLATLAGYEWFIDEPVPELLNTASQPSGWAELVETLIHKVFYPSDILYPSESLYPC